MRSNRGKNRYVGPNATHEGGPITEITNEQALRRSVASCLLWEDTFYEDGMSVSDRIMQLALECEPEIVSALAVEARDRMKLRHVPLWLCVALLKSASGTSIPRNTIAASVRRADEISELLVLYWAAHKRAARSTEPHRLPHQLKKGLQQAFLKFDNYQLDKYRGAGNPVSLRDVMFLVHPRPGRATEEGFAKLAAGEPIGAADTWEKRLSGGGDKKASFEDLLREDKLGYMALLRNLRNMVESKVDKDLVRKAILARKGASNVLPFRYVSAAKYAPEFKAELGQAMVKSLDDLPALPGKTVWLVDVSASMLLPLSVRSEIDRMMSAATLAAMGATGDNRVFTFSNKLVEVKGKSGFDLIEAIPQSQYNGGTALGAAVAGLNKAVNYDRIVVLTDEQSHDRVEQPKGMGYMINVATNDRSVAHGEWTSISGFSENVLRYIAEAERPMSLSA